MDTVWSFETKNYRVALEIEPCDDDPAGSFSYEGCEEEIEAIRDGRISWFDARVSVYKNGKRIGVDTLGACSYADVRDFYVSHRDRDPLNRNCSIYRAANPNSVICHYFPDMVSQAIADARTTLE